MISSIIAPFRRAIVTISIGRRGSVIEIFTIASAMFCSAVILFFLLFHLRLMDIVGCITFCSVAIWKCKPMLSDEKTAELIEFPSGLRYNKRRRSGWKPLLHPGPPWTILMERCRNYRNYSQNCNGSNRIISVVFGRGVVPAGIRADDFGEDMNKIYYSNPGFSAWIKRCILNGYSVFSLPLYPYLYPYQCDKALSLLSLENRFAADSATVPSSQGQAACSRAFGILDRLRRLRIFAVNTSRSLNPCSRCLRFPFPQKLNSPGNTLH